MNTIFKDRNNNLIDVSAFCIIPLQKKVYNGKDYVEIDSLRPSHFTKWVMKLSKFMKPFSPFDCFLRKIYGSEFFEDKPEEIPDFDGYIQLYRGDTDGDILRIGRCPVISVDTVKMAEKILGNKTKASNLVTKCPRLNSRTTLREFESWTSAQLRKAISRKLTLNDLHVMYVNEPIDGISEHEELILRGVFGIHEKKWRAQREFFEFACRPKYNVERSALVSAAHAVVEAMRLAGEDEETIRKYKKNFIAPALRKH